MIDKTMIRILIMHQSLDILQSIVSVLLRAKFYEANKRKNKAKIRFLNRFFTTRRQDRNLQQRERAKKKERKRNSKNMVDDHSCR